MIGSAGSCHLLECKLKVMEQGFFSLIIHEVPMYTVLCTRPTLASHVECSALRCTHALCACTVSMNTENIGKGTE